MSNLLVDIIVIGDSLEALAVRGALEYWGAKINLYFISKSQDMVEILNGKIKLSKNILIMGHGVKEGIILPGLDPNIAKEQPYDKILTPKNLKDFLKLHEQTVINTGCNTGTQKFADVFLKSGSKHYIAPTNYPEGSASLFYALNFYYFLVAKKLSVLEAHKKAQSADKGTKMFKLFET